jgi:hypothetical protein
MVNAMGRRIRRAAGLMCLGLAPLLAACQTACPLPGQVPMTALKLYFGRDIPGGGFVTDQAWADFAAHVLTPAFPDGLTTTEALGQWHNPQTGQIAREKSFVVEVEGSISPTRIADVTRAYRQTFHQVSVGQVTQGVCAAF